MRKKIQVVIGGYATSVYLKLEQFNISLSYNGDDKYVATKEIEIEGDLNILFQCYGWNGTDWQISLFVPGQNLPFYQKTGTIKNNYSILEDAVKVP